MLRILSTCTASVRTFLQGLDYFAIDESIEDLGKVVNNITLGPGQEWENSVQDCLKTEKMSLKGD
jgi:hypothetical protein